MSAPKQVPGACPSGFYAPPVRSNARPGSGNLPPPPAMPLMHQQHESFPYNYSGSIAPGTHYTQPPPPQQQYHHYHQQQYHQQCNSQRQIPACSDPAIAPQYTKKNKNKHSSPDKKMNGAGSKKRPRQENDALNSSSVLVSSSQWRCEPCNLSFESDSALKAHVRGHVVCTACEFSGSPKIVKAHYQAVHGKFSGSGFKTITVAVPGCPVQHFRICIGNRPEDIQKWKEERRRRFPRREQKKPLAEKESEEKNGLNSLLEGYGSSSSEEEEAPSKTPAVKTPNEITARKETDQQGDETNKPLVRKKLCRFFSRYGTCRNGESCTFSHDMSSAANMNHNMNSPNQRRHKLASTRRNQKAESSLLHKLLKNDMRREATLALQLLEFLVDSDFLQKEAGSTAKCSSSSDSVV